MRNYEFSARNFSKILSQITFCYAIFLPFSQCQCDFCQKSVRANLSISHSKIIPATYSRSSCCLSISVSLCWRVICRIWFSFSKEILVKITFCSDSFLPFSQCQCDFCQKNVRANLSISHSKIIPATYSRSSCCLSISVSLCWRVICRIWVSFSKFSSYSLQPHSLFSSDDIFLPFCQCQCDFCQKNVRANLAISHSKIIPATYSRSSCCLSISVSLYWRVICKIWFSFSN